MRMRTAAAALLAAGALLSAGPAKSATAPPPLVIVFMENHSASSILADPVSMPYLNVLWASAARERFTGYHAVTSSSFPNYSALAAGKVVTTGGPGPGQFNVPTIWDQLTVARVSWDVYEESMPAVCSPVSYHDDRTSGADGPYKIGHNPAVPFVPVYRSAECQHVRPFPMPAALPAVSFVAPNLCDDMHGVPSTDTNGYKNCVTGTKANERRADSWLATRVPAWTAAGADVFVTFDEGCCGSSQLYAVLTGPGVTGGTNPAVLNHYSLLAGIEKAYGLPLLANAASAPPIALP